MFYVVLGVEKIMSLFKRLVLLLIITIINATLFDFRDFEFWFIAIGLGIVFEPIRKGNV